MKMNTKKIAAIISAGVLISSFSVSAYSISKLFSPVTETQYVQEFENHRKSFSLIMSSLKDIGAAQENLKDNYFASGSYTSIDEAVGNLDFAIGKISAPENFYDATTQESDKINSVLELLEYSKQYLSSEAARNYAANAVPPYFPEEREFLSNTLQSCGQLAYIPMNKMESVASQAKEQYANAMSYSSCASIVALSFLIANLREISEDQKKRLR